MSLEMLGPAEGQHCRNIQGRGEGARRRKRRKKKMKKYGQCHFLKERSKI